MTRPRLEPMPRDPHRRWRPGAYVVMALVVLAYAFLVLAAGG